MGEQKAVLHADCVSANACVTLDELLPVSNKGEDRSFAFIRSQDLAKGEIKAIFNLTKANVSHYYAEWSDEEKMEELRSPTSRYLLVENNEDEDSLSYKAITSFRFEMDDFEVLPIMYCYELQVAQDFRGQGLGKTLLKALEDIGRHRRMRQVVLTVQKANLRARDYYQKLGYSTGISRVRDYGAAFGDFKYIKYTAFAPLSAGGNVDVFYPKLVFIALQIACLAVPLYQAYRLGLWPTTADWLWFEEHDPRIETSIGSNI